MHLYLWSVKRFYSSRPLASKRGGSDRRDSISSCLGGIQLLAGRRGREEEMKLLAFVAGLGIKDGGGIKSSQRASVCVSWGCRWSRRSGHPLFRQERYHLPNLRLTLMNLLLRHSNLRRQFFLTFEAHTHARTVATESRLSCRACVMSSATPWISQTLHILCCSIFPHESRIIARFHHSSNHISLDWLQLSHMAPHLC